jgi:hypothetical protein
MQADTKRILLQMLETDKDALQLSFDLANDDMSVIEALANRKGSAAVSAALQSVRATRDSVHGLVDRLERLADEVRRHC